MLSVFIGFGGFFLKIPSMGKCCLALILNNFQVKLGVLYFGYETSWTDETSKRNLFQFHVS